MTIRTTTIGSYPKPGWLRLPGFVPKHPDPTRRYSEFLASRTAEDDRLLERAVHETVAEQVAAGIDVPTDGETPREHYVFYHLRHWGGVDFRNLTETVKRGGAWAARLPTITGPVESGPPFLPDDWRRAQAATERPVKITLPGPMTVIDTTADAFYGDERKLAAALADALNREARALAAAGCRQIQIDEPVFARRPDAALAWGVEMLERAFHGLPAEVTRTVHVCCGYPSGLDLPDYPKADPQAYFALAPALDEAALDAVSIEDAHRHNDLALLDRFRRATVILGVVDIASTRLETPDEIVARLTAALGHVDRDRLMAAPDCGLAMLGRDLAFRKMQALCEGARAV